MTSRFFSQIAMGVEELNIGKKNWNTLMLLESGSKILLQFHD